MSFTGLRINYGWKMKEEIMLDDIINLMIIKTKIKQDKTVAPDVCILKSIQNV
jgi:hypothetical protein